MNPLAIREALYFIPAHDRDTWLRIGMAIKSELGDEGFTLWDGWSQRDESYSERDSKAVWRSIKANGKVTIATLFHEAQCCGFKFKGHAKSEPPNSEELAGRELQRQQAEAEEARRHEAVAKLAKSILAAANGDPKTHPYYVKKAVDLGPLIKRGA